MLAEAETKDEKYKKQKKDFSSRLNKKRKSNINEASMSQEDDNVSIRCEQEPDLQKNKKDNPTLKSILKNP